MLSSPVTSAIRVRPTAAKWLEIAHAHGGAMWRELVCATMDPAGVEIEVVLDGVDPVEAYVWDASPGLPEAAAPLLSARPDWAVPFGPGDRTVVFGKTRL